MRRLPDLATARAAWWARRAIRRMRRELPVHGVRATVPPPPVLPARAGRGVIAAVARASPTCLESALVLQRWLADHDEPRDVVIGVQLLDGERVAHAWVDGQEPGSAAAYTELHRIPSP